MITELKNIPRTMRPGQRLLGLDLGSKTIGLAVSDPALRVASPIDTIKRTKFIKDLPALQNVIHDYNIGGLIFGWPLNMDGTISRRCQATNQFVLNLGYEGIDVQTAYFDERMSTMAVERVLINEADMSRSKRSQVVDKMAASFILQGALDFFDNMNNQVS